MANLSGGLDSNQVIIEAFDKDFEVLKIRNIGGSLVPDVFDEINLTYVPSGFGAGQIQTVSYKLSSVLIATLTLTYDASDRIISVIRT